MKIISSLRLKFAYNLEIHSILVSSLSLCQTESTILPEKNISLMCIFLSLPLQVKGQRGITNNGDEYVKTEHYFLMTFPFLITDSLMYATIHRCI